MCRRLPWTIVRGAKTRGCSPRDRRGPSRSCGGATAVFSAAETLLLRPLPYRDGERLVTLRSYRPLDDFPFTRAAGGTLVDWQQQATSFDAVAGYRWGTLDLIDGVRSHRLNGLAATPEFFDVFGVALNGRAFAAADQSFVLRPRRGSRRPAG